MNVFYLLTWMVLVLGVVNLVRMAMFMVGSDIYGLKAYLGSKKKKLSSNHSVLAKNLPRLSVIIPAHNEEDTILRCVKSVVEANYPRSRLQIIVANDGSTDSTAAVVANYKKKDRLKHLKVLTLPHGGKAHALNEAMKQAGTGELIMCLDADSIVEQDALMNAAAHFEDPNTVAMAANVKIMDDGSLLGLIQQFEYIISYQMKRAQTIFNVEYIVGGIGSTFRRSILKKVEFYDTNTVTEDIDLTMKIISEGNKSHRIIYGADVVVHTESVKSISGLIKQRFRWKYGRCQTFWKRRHLFFNRDRKYSRALTWVYLPFAIFSDLSFLLEPLVVTFLLFITFWFKDPLTLFTAFLVISSYIGLNILAEDTIPWRQKLKFLPLVPTMYLFFYVLSFVEYVALIKSIPKLFKLRQSVEAGICSWEHVSRHSVTS